MKTHCTRLETQYM